MFQWLPPHPPVMQPEAPGPGPHHAAFVLFPCLLSAMWAGKCWSTGISGIETLFFGGHKAYTFSFLSSARHKGGFCLFRNISIISTSMLLGFTILPLFRLINAY